MEPVVFNHTGHKEMWNWLAEHPDKDETYWPGWEYNGGEYGEAVCNCFACDFVDKYNTISQKPRETSCDYCPICDEGRGSCLEGLYDDWDDSENIEERAELARIIRDLPVRDIPNMVVK